MGFEPTVAFTTAVFKTATLSLSVTSPFNFSTLNYTSFGEKVHNFHLRAPESILKNKGLRYEN